VTTSPQGPWKILLVEDDSLIASLVADGLRSFGHDVMVADRPSTAEKVFLEFDPHLLVSDLNFPAGESGAKLMAYARSHRPWVAVMVLSSHRSPQLAVADAELIPGDAVYLVKSSVGSVAQLHEGVVAAIVGGESVSPEVDGGGYGDEILVSATHADVLRMLADGSSTRALAQARATSVRAVESMLVRLYRVLGIDLSSEINPRVVAIHLWMSGKVRVVAVAPREKAS
jgi:DNA-binding NarL/FixJ family response regulator